MSEDRSLVELRTERTRVKALLHAAELRMEFLEQSWWKGYLAALDWLRAPVEATETKKRMKSKQQERDGMRRFGGVVNPRSGARWDRKNDGHTGAELVEFKRTNNRRQITLNFTDLRDLERHALTEGRYPVLDFELGDHHWVVIPEHDYLDRVARSDPDLTSPGASTSVVRAVQVPGELRSQPGQPVLRRSSAQRSGPARQSDLSRHPSRLSRSVSSQKRVPGIRPGPQREVGRVGRVLRKRTTPDQTAASS